MKTVWVFNGERSAFPSGVFTARELAEAWIAKHALTGCLTMYPLDQGAYDWSINEGLFKVKRQEQTLPEFIGRFTGGSTHYHYESGERTA